jgi:nicotinamide mononucleotide transporter
VAVQPRWATPRERLWAAVGAIVMLIVFYFALRALGSWGPAADSWVLTGSILATYGMARGWNEFWFVWIAVDLVGVPLLLSARYYPSALMYTFYAGFCIYGFITWWRSEHPLEQPAAGPPQG